LAIVVFSVATIPCTISTAGRDEFRAPKEFPLRGTGVLIAASLVLGYLFWAVELRQELKACRIPLYFGIAVVAWTTIVTATSLNPPLSVWNLIYACASMLTADISRLIGACPSNSRDRRSDESDALYS
jgi:hypothetical protein